MAEIVYMPKLSDTMTDGVVASWNKNIGDSVEAGEVLAEIETDKATMEFESFYDGVLLHIGVETGSKAPVNSVLAIIGDKDEDVNSILEGESKKINKSSKEKVSEQPKKEVEKETIKGGVVKQVPIKTNSSKVPSIQTETPSGDRVFASPLAKKLAKERNIDISRVIGTGDGGRVTKVDIDNYVPYTGGASFRSSPGLTEENYTDEPVSQMRETIARRLAESKFTAPHFYLNLEIDMSNAISFRAQANSKEGVKISYNDMVIKAVSLALKEHPNVNSAWMGDFIRRNSHVNIGVAVAVEEGLLVPVVRYADTKSMDQISTEVKGFAQKAKEKKLQPSDWEGNTFTISNLGMFGIDSFTAIVNPPDSCILAVGGIKEVPVVKDGCLVPGSTMKVTLSCDHRVVDGASGAAFLQTFKQFLENPVTMLF